MEDHLPEAGPKVSAQARGREAAPKRSARARGREAGYKISAQVKGHEAGDKMSAQARGHEAGYKISARGPSVAMEDVLQEPVSDKVMKAVITEVTSDQVQPSPRSPNTTAASRFSEETLSILLEVEAPKVKPELSGEKPSVVIDCVPATTSDLQLQHPMVRHNNLLMFGKMCCRISIFLGGWGISTLYHDKWHCKVLLFILDNVFGSYCRVEVVSVL